MGINRATILASAAFSMNFRLFIGFGNKCIAANRARSHIRGELRTRSGIVSQH